MPRPPAILASLILVNFIAVGKVPKAWLHPTFRVRRAVLLRALEWLKENNPKYYGDIEISEDRLNELPEDNVPEEINAIVCQMEDIGILEGEMDGYVPRDENEGEHTFVINQLDLQISLAVDYTPDDAEIDGDHMREGEPDVIPLQLSGSVDTNMTTATSNELMLSGLANLWQEGQEGGYAVRHGRQPVHDFGRRLPGELPSTAEENEYNFFERAYPCLFPYGEGGIEGTQKVKVDFTEHVRWALRYHDRRFRRHETFPFVAFGIQQRRQSLASARVQMSRQTFERDAIKLSTLTVDKLQQAEEEEEGQGKYITDPTVKLLRQHIYATAGRVMGSNHA